MPSGPDSLITVSTRLGWMAALASGSTLRQLTFGHRTRAAAVAALDPELVAEARPEKPTSRLAARLRAYAEGRPDDFADIACDPGAQTPFAKRVLEACRRIAFGETCTYRELACRIGSPGAARAVGQVMARNRIPLVIPCHRVVSASGRLGGFSAPGGADMKRRLIELEAS